VLKKNILILLPLMVVLLSCGSSSGRADNDVRTGRAPLWVTSVESVFPAAQYAAAVGYASTREEAEENAFAALASFLGYSVERTAASFYRQAVVNGVMESWVDTAEMRSNIRAAASMNDLIGAEIRDVWFDSKDTYYAVAVMEKSAAARIYGGMLRVNLAVINNLVNMTPNERNSLNGVIRFRFAAVAADVNVSYKNAILQLGGAVSETVEGGDRFRLEARNIIRTIPMGIRVSNDRNGRISGAFTRSLTNYGFNISSRNPRYMLNANVSLMPVDLPDNPNVFYRIEVNANLTDTEMGLVLLPYNFNNTDGHFSRAEAENRSFLAAERNIGEDFTRYLTEYLTSLMPRIR